MLFVQRHPRSAFMGGAHVFPGGKMDPADTRLDLAVWAPVGASQACARALEPTPGQPVGTAKAAGLTGGLHVAAVRELFEEAGVLLARYRDGTLPGVRSSKASERWAQWRQALHSGEAVLEDVLAAENLMLDLRALAYWAHWVSPPLQPHRFDARFFLARLPPGQEPSADSPETTGHVWLSPKEALDAHAGGRMVLPPPTYFTLWQISRVRAIEALFCGAAHRRVAAVMPKVVPDGTRTAILLPWDPDYRAAAGEALPGLDGPSHPTADDGPSRLVLSEPSAQTWARRAHGR